MPQFTGLKDNKLIQVNLKKFIISWNTPSCSAGQTFVKSFLKQYWQFDLYVLEEFRVPRSRMRIDFLNATKKLCVEFNGEQHKKMIPFFHKTPLDFAASVKRDCLKEEWATRNFLKTLVLTDEDLPFLSPAYIKTKFDIDIT